jgi:heme/copper-type cytochrome/quinol oxidase subunit 3
MNPNQIAALICIAIFIVGTLALFYFKSKQADSPSKTEKTMALLWLVLRRTVCFIAAVPFLGAGIKLMFFSEMNFNNVSGSLITLLMGASFLWVGFYGQGWTQRALKDDVALHKKNKHRYRWRW